MDLLKPCVTSDAASSSVRTLLPSSRFCSKDDVMSSVQDLHRNPAMETFRVAESAPHITIKRDSCVPYRL